MKVIQILALSISVVNASDHHHKAAGHQHLKGIKDLSSE